MSGLIHERFLLQNEEAVRLYQDHAAGLPIIDFHTHLPPAEIAADRRWDNLSQVWLNGDHYKWRQMRANGIAERFCTGDATDREKFDAFAAPCRTCCAIRSTTGVTWSWRATSRSTTCCSALGPRTRCGSAAQPSCAGGSRPAP